MLGGETVEDCRQRGECEVIVGMRLTISITREGNYIHPRLVRSLLPARWWFVITSLMTINSLAHTQPGVVLLGLLKRCWWLVKYPTGRTRRTHHPRALLSLPQVVPRPGHGWGCLL